MIVEDSGKKCQPAARTKCNKGDYYEIDDDILPVRFAGFAIVFRATVLAPDVGYQRGTERAAPPCETDFLCFALSTIWTRSILGCILHVFSPIFQVIFEPSLRGLLQLRFDLFSGVFVPG